MKVSISVTADVCVEEPVTAAAAPTIDNPRSATKGALEADLAERIRDEWKEWVDLDTASVAVSVTLNDEDLAELCDCEPDEVRVDTSGRITVEHLSEDERSVRLWQRAVRESRARRRQQEAQGS